MVVKDNVELVRIENEAMIELRMTVYTSPLARAAPHPVPHASDVIRLHRLEGVIEAYEYRRGFNGNGRWKHIAALLSDAAMKRYERRLLGIRSTAEFAELLAELRRRAARAAR